jgi:uncharacterized membrane protein
MSPGGYRAGSGRPRVHVDASGNSTAVKVQLLLTRDVNTALQQLADADGICRSEVIRRLIQAAVRRPKKRQP